MPRSNAENLHGILAIDKPAGWTSHDVVARLRRLTGTRRVGHAGTLDPFATGVLVVAVGRATRLLRYTQAGEKRYLAHLVLGVETDTLDIEGRIVQRYGGADWPSQGEVTGVVQRHIGSISQIPPAFSAIRVDGERLYKRARAGEHVEAPARTVEISDIDVLRYQPPDLLIDVQCGTGTYIRSLARDIGAGLGTYAYCHGLRRTAVGPFTLGSCWSLDELEGLDLRESWPLVAEAPDAGLREWPVIVLAESDESPWYDGRLIDCPPGSPEGEPDVRVYTSSGIFVGLGRVLPERRLKPEMVFKID